MKYRKKPVIIEAVQWVGEQNCVEVFEFLGFEHPKDEADHSVIFIPTLEGTMEASPGDFIIRGVQGELYPCKPDIFDATYEPVEVLLKMTAPTHADLLARIAELRALDEARTPGVWEASKRGIEAGRLSDVLVGGQVECMSYCYGGSSTIEGDNIEADTIALTTAVNHFGPLLTLAEGVLRRHEPFYGPEDDKSCTCQVEGSWPCPEVRAVIEALGMGGGE